MILIDLVYIGSLGGITLSKTLLDYLIVYEKKENFQLLVDKKNSKYFDQYNIFKNEISKNEFSRFLFYKKNMKRFKSVLCFANVPPPLKIKSKTFIYFHNEILLDSKNLGLSVMKQLTFRLKWIYIKSRNSSYTWLVQTQHIKELLNKKLNNTENNVIMSPIFEEEKLTVTKKKPSTFIYPSSNNPHKNNFRLLNAFIKAAKETPKEIELFLTIEKVKLNVPKNLKINFLGLIDNKKLLFYMKKVEFLIFPSLKESFGLPLIEGIQANCKILCSDLNFAKELINPSYFFNPHNEKSISEAILLALSNKKHQKSSIKIKNRTDLIFNYLNNV